MIRLCSQVIIDFYLSDMSGDALLQLVRQVDPTTAVVMISSDASVRDTATHHAADYRSLIVLGCWRTAGGRHSALYDAALGSGGIPADAIGH